MQTDKTFGFQNHGNGVDNSFSNKTTEDIISDAIFENSEAAIAEKTASALSKRLDQLTYQVKVQQDAINQLLNGYEKHTKYVEEAFDDVDKNLAAHNKRMSKLETSTLKQVEKLLKQSNKAIYNELGELKKEFLYNNKKMTRKVKKFNNRTKRIGEDVDIIMSTAFDIDSSDKYGKKRRKINQFLAKNNLNHKKRYETLPYKD